MPYNRESEIEGSVALCGRRILKKFNQGQALTLTGLSERVCNFMEWENEPKTQDLSQFSIICRNFGS